MSHISNFAGTAVRQYVINGVTYSNTVCYVGDLPDDPTITTEELKYEFDKGSFEAQRFINEVIVPKINDLDDSQQSGVQVGGVQPYHLNASTNTVINSVALNAANNAAEEEKIRAEAAYVKKGRFTNAAEILGDATITEVLIADSAVTRNKISNDTINSILLEEVPSDRIFNSVAEYNNSVHFATNRVCYVKAGS